MQMPDEMVLQISKRVAESSQTIQIFHINHNSASLPASDSVCIENRKDILKIFGIPWVSDPKKLDFPSKHYNVHSSQDHF
jgi:hypothetical protein